MKKIRIKLKYDELNAVSNRITFFIQNTNFKKPDTKMIMALLMQFNMNQQKRLFLEFSKPVIVSFDIPTACAFVIFCGWQHFDASKYEENVLIKINNQLQQQLA